MRGAMPSKKARGPSRLPYTVCADNNPDNYARVGIIMDNSKSPAFRLARPNESCLFGLVWSRETNIGRALLEQSNSRFAAAARRRRNGDEHL